jgi:hypothetical protein
MSSCFNSRDRAIQIRPYPTAWIALVTTAYTCPKRPAIAAGAPRTHSETTHCLSVRVVMSLTAALAALCACAALSAAPAAAQTPGGCVVPMAAGSSVPRVPCPRSWSPQPVQPIDGSVWAGRPPLPEPMPFPPPVPEPS